MRVGPDTVLVTDRMLKNWQKLPNNSVIDIDDDMMHAALEIVGRSLFGTDLAGDVEKTAKATLDALDIIVARARTPITFPKWIPTPNNRKLAKALKQLDGAVQRILDERKKITAIAGVDRDVDMLDLLLAAHDDEGGLNSKELRDQIVTFIVAGHETVASSLTWTWWLLGSHQDVQTKLQKEVDEVLQGRAPEVKDVANLPYTRAVVDEALRIFPPGWVVSRRSLGDDVLGGYEIPEKAVVIISPWATHRHPEAWNKAESFDPTRFMPDAPTPQKGTYLPFGIGPRMCIGKDFAILESVLMIARIAQEWNLTPAGSEPVPRALVMVRPAGGLPMFINRRN
jgi:cytochrome P450